MTLSRQNLTPPVFRLLRTSMVPALLGSVLVLGAGPAAAEEKILDRTFTVAPGGLLTVTADGADVSVSGSDTNQVVVHMVVQASKDELDAMKLSASQSGDGVTVEMRSPERGWFNWSSRNVDARIEVKVPRDYRVETRTSGGDVRLENTAGTSRVRTSGGDILARNLKGDVDGSTSGGDVRLQSIEGLVDVHTSGGDIEASAVKGGIKADTSGGDVRLMRIDGTIRASTSGGNVECELVGANRGISARTSGGDVRVTMPRNTAGTLNAESSGGRINSDFQVGTSRWEEHRLNGVINGGGEAILVNTSGGSITLSAAN